MTTLLLRLLLPLAVLASAGVLRAQELSAADRDRARAHLEKTRDALAAATADLSAEQWNFKPGPDRWSVAEVTEHLASAEDFLRTHIEDNVLTAPPREESVDLAAIDQQVLSGIADRSHRVQAPEPLAPSNRYGSPDAALDAFKSSREKTLALLEQTPDLRAHAVDSPLGLKLDGYQWLLFLSAHTERHTKQIEEVKAHPDFPRQ